MQSKYFLTLFNGLNKIENALEYMFSNNENFKISSQEILYVDIMTKIAYNDGK